MLSCSSQDKLELIVQALSSSMLSLQRKEGGKRRQSGVKLSSQAERYLAFDQCRPSGV